MSLQIIIIHVKAQFEILSFFQGKFIHWSDGSPVSFSDWNMPSLDKLWHPYNITVSFFDERMTNYIIQQSTNSILKISTLNQPEENMDRNCTAVLMFAFGYPNGWVVIPCDMAFEATFFCIKSQPHFEDKRVLSFPTVIWPDNDIVCNHGWTRIEKSCFTLWDIDEPISFIDGDKMCQAGGASIPYVDDVDVTTVPYADNEKITHVFFSLFQQFDKLNIWYKINSINLLHNLILGYPIDITNRNSLMYVLNLVEDYMTTNITIMTKQKSPGICWLAEHTFWQISYPTDVIIPGEWLDQWGLKYRPCEQKVKPNILICEQKAIVRSIICTTGHFACLDNTCILFLYVCDGVHDCFDGSDENCTHDNYTTSLNITNTYPKIPCSITEGYINKTVSLVNFCDGIDTCANSLEKRLCNYTTIQQVSFYTTVNKTQKNSGIQMVKVDAFENNKYLAILETELKYYEIMKQSNFIRTSANIDSNLTFNLTPFQLPCYGFEYSISYNDLCVAVPYKPSCSHRLQVACNKFVCPGMFKCRDSYCLYMSSVCDGYMDCRYGEDESSCSILSCPGLLKCRGENRCVSEVQLCNGRADCQFSFDDELHCDECPPNCKCEGYIAYCQIRHHSEMRSTRELRFLKGVVFTVVSLFFYLDELVHPIWIYTDLSNCGINLILHSDTQAITQKETIFANFSNNFISNTDFLIHSKFIKCIILDLSNNNIIEVDMLDFIQLDELTILFFDQNPLIVLSVFVNVEWSNLQILSLTKLETPSKNIVILGRPNNILISFSIYASGDVCCIFHGVAKCDSTDGFLQCNGLFQKRVDQILFACLASSSLTLTLISVIQHCLQMNMSRLGKHYFINLVNRALSDLMCALYLLSISTVDLMQINIVTWQNNLFCFSLKTIFFVSIEASLCFKAFAALVVLIKVTFPFQHQCRWLCYMWAVVGAVWTCLITLYLINVRLGDLYINKYCTYLGCESNNLHISLTSKSTLAIGLSLIILLLLMVISTLIILANKTISFGMNTKKSLTLAMIYQATFPFFIEFILHTVFFLIILKHAILLYLDINTCHLILYYTVSLKLILSVVLYMIPSVKHKKST